MKLTTLKSCQRAVNFLVELNFWLTNVIEERGVADQFDFHVLICIK